MADTNCAKLLSWVQSFFFNIILSLNSPLPLCVDNTSAIACANNESVKSKSRHIDRRYHYIHEQIQGGALEVWNVPTTEMIADFLPKPLGPKGIVHALKIDNMG